MEGLVEEKESLSSQLVELRRAREELTTDNRRLAEILVTTEAESEEAAAMLENLTRERRELRKQSLQLRESGEGREGTFSFGSVFIKCFTFCFALQSRPYRGGSGSWRGGWRVVGTRRRLR